MFKIAYNANGLRNMDVVSAIREVKKYGYDGIELSLHKDHLHPNYVTENDLNKIKEELEAQILIPACLSTGCSDLLSKNEYDPSLISPTVVERKVRIKCIKKAIDIAKFLNIPIVNISSGLKKNIVSDDDARRSLIEGIKECLNYTQDIILAIEPEPNMFIETTEQAIDIIENVGSNKLKLNLDVGHVVCCEENIMSKIKNACKYTAHIHIEDIKNRIHYHEIPGEGDVDLKTILKILYSEKYEGFVSVELYHHANVYETALEKSYAYLTKIKNEIR